MKRRRYKTPEESFSARTERQDGCLVWTGAAISSGYGHLTSGGKQVLVHRYAWERVNGPIPNGIFLDHICHNRLCADIGHLRLATPKQNGEHLDNLQINNRGGYRGAIYCKFTGRWQARVVHNRKNYFLGRYDTAAEAGEVARLKRLELYTHNEADRMLTV